jgi:hypothetical protein
MKGVSAMTNYTVHFYTEADWANSLIEAHSPENALEAAKRIADGDGFWELDFQAYDNTASVERIEIFDEAGHPVAEWKKRQLRLRLAASELLDALEKAVEALNTAPRFKVPGLDTDSYAVAAICDEAIALAKGGAQ